MTPMTYDEMRPGCYDPKARLEDQEVNHVEASLCFPTFPRFCGQAFTEHPDRDLGLASAHLTVASSLAPTDRSIARASLSAAAAELRRAGACRVDALVLARTP